MCTDTTPAEREDYAYYISQGYSHAEAAEIVWPTHEGGGDA